MFETAQQEPSGGNTKIVAGVIVVLMVVLVGVYFAFFRGQPEQAATPQPMAAAGPSGPANTPVPDADYQMDLAIQRSNLGRDQTQTMAMWDVQISNRSREITYRNIQYATNYYDAGDNVIQQGSGVFSGELVPGGVETFGEINDGLYPLTTARYTIEITSAEGFKP